MKLKLTYGQGNIELSIPDKNLSGYIEPAPSAKAFSDPMAELDRLMENPHGEKLEQLVKGRSACVLVEDHTRSAPYREMLGTVIPRLVHANSIQFIVATGSHEVEHPGNLEIVETLKQTAHEAGLRNFRARIHDCHASDMVNLGKTSRGTPVIVSSDAIDHSVYVALSDMKAHYFAGYSNALKDFLPGVCAFATIEANHAMALDANSTFGRHPYHPDREKRDNPLADDMREAMEMITKDARVFTLAVISSGRKIIWADAGRIRPVIERGIEVLDETSSFTVKSTPRIIVSPGGYPEDKSLYHAQRALELTKNAVSDGGEILFLAECRDGVAPDEAIENFYNKLKAPLDDVLKSISDVYHLYEHKAYKFAELLKRVSAIKMLTSLDHKTVSEVHLEKAESAQAVVDEWIADNPKVKILVFDKGNKLAVYST